MDSSFPSSENTQEFRTEFSKIFSVINSYAQGDDGNSVENPMASCGNLNSPNEKNTNYADLGLIVFTLKDGTTLAVNMTKNPDYGYAGQAKKLSGYIANIIVDVNGKKGPNVMGRDVFHLYVYNNGTVDAYGSKQNAEYHCTDPNSNCIYYWNGTHNEWTSCDLESAGETCAARIIEEGWQMKY